MRLMYRLRVVAGDKSRIAADAQRGRILVARPTDRRCTELINFVGIGKPADGRRILDLTSNNITEVGEFDLAGVPDLEELILADNRLEKIHPRAFASNTRLKRLSLGNCGLSEVPWEAFVPLRKLSSLELHQNDISQLEQEAFENMTELRHLRLDSNRLKHIPTEAFAQLSSLEALNLGNNQLTYIPVNAFLMYAKRNQIVSIHDDAFNNLTSLRVLELDDNLLTYIPITLTKLVELQELSVSGNKIKYIPSGILQKSQGLAYLELKGNPLVGVDPHAFSFLPKLRKLTCPRIKSLDLKSNNLRKYHSFLLCKDLRVLDLAGTKSHPWKELCLTRLQVLDLESNLIEDVHPQAFLKIKQLEDLNLGNNIFPSLPTDGLDRLLHLKTFNNPRLRVFPSPEKFPRVQTLVLSYAYHCCAFLPLIPLEPPVRTPVHESILFPTDNEFDMSLWNSSLPDIWPQLQNLSKKFGPHINQLLENFGTDFTYPGNLPAYVEEYFEEQELSKQLDSVPGRIHCLPTPGPFLPCVDLFDWWTLRCGVWIVFLLAMLGNGTVVFVLVFSRSKIDVPRFLVCNLAAADFFMGVYLGMLAVVDASTLGEFEMYAIPWQMSAGCQLAGFLGVLSSELSVYTLAVITLERNYAITHAMHLNKRLSLKHAGYIMLCGWTFALTMAALPLLGISDYRKFATCLPFEISTPWSLAYVTFLMFINGVAFLILMGCYLKMYCAIRGSQAWNSNDSRIAKRMALLVFTDFLCWSPIAFFSLTAAFGLQLVSLEQAKVFTVFVLPLNSCCNPFLYAILTKQFKKDCILICKAIEESRVTRGIGRCRHSSNFSNRQTPANTNSLVDRSSRDAAAQAGSTGHQPPCSCNVKLLGSESGGGGGMGHVPIKRTPTTWLVSKIRWVAAVGNWCLQRDGRGGGGTHHHHRHRGGRSDQYAYQIAEIQQKQHKRTSSVSSSENFSSSRSDSWRQNHHQYNQYHDHHHHHHHCGGGGIPMRLLDPKRRASSWIVTRKTSQDSNLSSSRNDSSGSATTNSTTMSRVSRSSNSSEIGASVRPNKPRLTRQSAFQDDADLSTGPVVAAPGSPSKLTVRFLTTIPSAETTIFQAEPTAEGVEEQDPAGEDEEEDSPSCYAILHASAESSPSPNPSHSSSPLFFNKDKKQPHNWNRKK
ncbi:receptor [Nesidiocoris tenuis]|uniref:Receptor n=1 Tax=Nesidiocoris tenuis TaxID=355587 RepID=A0ABN7AGZ4_9HEMI|nr:receptor [Nesidiocoris tenuis]